MAIKKSELYSAIYESCNKLRGGMDASQYKDYVLVVLFMKYISDKAKVDKDSLIELPEGCTFDDLVKAKSSSNIGEKFNEVLEKVAEANPDLRNVITNADFCDEQKLGKGEDLVKTVSGLIGVFQNPNLNFSKNREDDDDLIGDAYEFLMKNFASQSGKSKGQFYTPAEVSRLIAKLVGIGKDERQQISIYDPTCGSGSLLLRAKAEAHCNVSVNGQESDLSTIGMAKMNMIIHGEQTADLRHADVINSPQHYNIKDVELQQFDYVVANPPFSQKSWLKSAKVEDTYGRWGEGIGIGVPPEKCGDYAFLLHIIKSLNHKGRGACILPHGVLFRGNAEAVIRKYIVKKHYIKGIIGLPSNLFYGTGIPACILLLDKAGALDSTGIFMINANEGFAKDGAKNRLREQDIKRINDTWDAQQDVPHYARFVTYDEIEANDYNLNLPRYIVAEDKEVVQDIEAHLHGGIPEHDIEQMQTVWTACPRLQGALFAPERSGYFRLVPEVDHIREAIAGEPSFVQQSEEFYRAIDAWRSQSASMLKGLTTDCRPKVVIPEISQPLLSAVNASPCLVDGYNAYDQLMNYWAETMQDDCYIVADNGWNPELSLPLDKKGKVKRTFTYENIVCDLLPVNVVIDECFPTERDAIRNLTASVDAKADDIASYEEEHDELNDYTSLAEVKIAYFGATCPKPLEGEKEILLELLAMPAKSKEEKAERKAFVGSHNEIFGSWEKTNTTDVNRRLREIDWYVPLSEETIAVLKEYIDLNKELDTLKAQLKSKVADLTKKVIEKYGALSEDEVKHLVVDCKWMKAILSRLTDEMTAVTQGIADNVTTLAARYAQTLGAASSEVAELESKVMASLEEMGFNL